MFVLTLLILCASIKFGQNKTYDCFCSPFDLYNIKIYQYMEFKLN